MIEIKTKTAAFLFIFISVISVFACACSGSRNDTPPHEKISFSDGNGISFSLQVTPCSDGRNGKINLDIYSESPYLYSTDFGRSFRRARSSGTSLNRLAEDSYSFCLMERDMPDTVTDNLHNLHGQLTASLSYYGNCCKQCGKSFVGR